MVMGQDFQASPLGTGLILVGVACWTLAANLAGRLDMPDGAMGFAAEMLTAGVIALAVSAALGERWELPHTLRVWGAWAYLVVFGSLIAFSAYRYLVDRVSPTLAATYAYVNPPVALFVGWWLGSETFSANTFIGLPIVLVAVGLHAWVWKTAADAAKTKPTPLPATQTETAYRSSP
jgi:drug/metabolite transporter (DMT)-like permease